ncbi:hypothetical protein A4A49_25265 [Nicotiana attenuata]|uniref:Copper transporter n=1 Tax=Nicotiana attenuata TaxID=49451 RepID=A0A1J6KCM8_NICAT|nr:hypothetical protein A4A49_25265 [Nicotiana attenuata]
MSSTNYSVSSSYWISYVKRQFPGLPDSETKWCFYFLVSLIFLLASMSEFCSLYPFTEKKEERSGLKVLLQEAGFHGFRMFTTYLVIIFIITTDSRFFLVAVSGHATGRFVCKVYQYHNDQAMSIEPPSDLVIKV